MTELTKKVEELESALEALADKRPDDREERTAWMEKREVKKTEIRVAKDAAAEHRRGERAAAKAAEAGEEQFQQAAIAFKNLMKMI